MSTAIPAPAPAPTTPQLKLREAHERLLAAAREFGVTTPYPFTRESLACISPAKREHLRVLDDAANELAYHVHQREVVPPKYVVMVRRAIVAVLPLTPAGALEALEIASRVSLASNPLRTTTIIACR